MTDDENRAIERATRPGALTRRGTGQLVSRGLADLERAEPGSLSPKECFERGMRLHVEGKFAEATRWYRLAADQGHARAQCNLGIMYATGRGVPQDDAEAVRWYRLAADQGHADAQYNLGFRYANGLGIPQDYVQAHMWYSLAASRSTGGYRETFAENRDVIADQLTPDELNEAQRLAREMGARYF
jgi:hypothetical protein